MPRVKSRIETIERATLAGLLGLACSAPAAPGSKAPEPTGAPTSPDSPSTPAEPAPLAGETAIELSLPCAGDDGCPHRARFAAAVTLYVGPDGEETVATEAPETSHWNPHGDPRIANPDEAGDARSHVVCRSAKLTTEVFVDREGLLPVVSRFVLATPDPTAEATASHDSPVVGVALAPGAAVEKKRDKGEFVEVGFEEGVVTGKGWIPRSAIGRTFIAPEDDPRQLPNNGRFRVKWESAIPVRATPGGKAFASIRGPATIQPLEQTRGKHLLGAVAFVLEERTYAIGWIAEAAVEKGKRQGGVVGGVVVGMPAPDAKTVSVSAGTELVSRSGHVVAVVTDDATLECLSDCETQAPVVELRCVAAFPARVRVG